MDKVLDGKPISPKEFIESLEKAQKEREKNNTRNEKTRNEEQKNIK
ncbi:hypothetical protein [Macrococcoides caseolyticum]|nr:hypothetical protein [Macrococcus caseolyticus]